MRFLEVNDLILNLLEEQSYIKSLFHHSLKAGPKSEAGKPDKLPSTISWPHRNIQFITNNNYCLLYIITCFCFVGHFMMMPSQLLTRFQ